MSEHTALVRAWSVSVGRYVAAAAFGFVWTIIITRSTPTAEAGLILMIGSLPGLLVPLLDAGMPAAVAYHLAGGFVDRTLVTRWVMTTTAFLSVIAFSVGAGGIAIARVGGTAALLLLGLAAVIFSICISFFAAHYRGRKNFRAHALLTVAPFALLAVSTFVAVSLGRADSTTLVALMVLSYGLPSIAVLMVGIPFKPLTKDDLAAYLRQGASYSWRIYISEAANSLRSRVDIVIVTAVAGTSAAAVLGTASMVAANLGLVSQAAHLVVFPFVAESAAEGRRSASQTEITSRLALIATLLGCAAAGALGATGFSLLFGDGFAESWLIFLAYIPGVLGLSVSRIVTADLMARGAVSQVMKISVGSSCVGVVLLVIGVLAAGPFGAGAAISTTALLNTAWRIWTLHHLADLHIPSLFVPHQSDVSALRSLFSRQG